MIHGHLPKAAGNLNGNVIENNVIPTNLTPDQNFTPYVDSETTGVVVASLSPLSITVKHNTIGRNTYGIWAMPAVTFVGGISSNRVASPSQPLCMATPADTAFGTPSGCTTGP